MKKGFRIVPASTKDLDSVITFLLPFEKKCVSLVARIVEYAKSHDSKKQTVYIITNFDNVLKQETTHGVFVLTNTGILLHHLVFHNVQNVLLRFLKKRYLFSVAGSLSGSSVFEDVLPNTPKTIYDYYLMEHNKASTFIQKNLPNNFVIHRCSLDDASALFELQKKYQIEEVLPRGTTLNDNQCKILLKNRLLEQKVYAIKSLQNNCFVAMAGTNAIGINCVQLGGIYTKTEYRGRGFAQILVSTIVNGAEKHPVLFVKKQNLPAIKAYKNANFSIIDSYRICYM